MLTRSYHRRAAFLFAAGVLALATLSAAAAHAADENMLLFREHCTKQDQKQCPFYKVEDPTSLGTQDLKVGDVLDLDIVLINSGKLPVRKARTWLSYDTQILEGSGVTLNLGLPIRLPGESEFSVSDGYVKIGASAEEGAEPKDEIFPIARVQFRVKAVPAGNKLPLAFYDLKPGVTGHTFVTSSSGDNASNILSAPAATLIVHITGTPVATAASASSSSSSFSTENLSFSSANVSSVSSSSSSRAPTVNTGNAFPVLQVQNVKIGTDSSTIFLSWEALNSPALKAYNVYYGTTMGHYIQRRTVSAETKAVVIHGVPPGTTYYAAVRGVNEQSQETAFSKEVAVQVGNPNSSTSPLLVRPQESTQQTANLTAPQNPVQTGTRPQEVPGSSGLPSGLVVLVLFSAVSGTIIALRRQFSALPGTHHD